MKKRKIKLFASIASLALVVAVAGVGVWAATQQTVRVTSKIQFNSSSISANVSLQVGNGTATVASAYKATNGVTNMVGASGTQSPEANYTTKGQIATFAAGTVSQTFSTEVLVSLTPNDNGFVLVGDTFTYTFEIENSATTGGNNVYAVITSTDGTTPNVDVDTIGYKASSMSYYVTNTTGDNPVTYFLEIAPGETGCIQITFKITATTDDDTLNWGNYIADTDNNQEGNQPGYFALNQVAIPSLSIDLNNTNPSGLTNAKPLSTGEGD